MRTRTFLLLTALAMASCDRARTSVPAPDVALTPRALPSLPLQIGLPGDARLQPASGGVQILIHPGQRAPLQIDIVRDESGGAFLGADRKTRALTPSLQLTYHEKVVPTDGSGGDDHVLDGVLVLAGTSYRITCSQQAEWPASAQSCLPMLATLQALPRGR